MSRTLPNPIDTLCTQPTLRAVHLLRFTIGASSWYFAESRQRIAGNDYLPYLRIERGPRYTRAVSTPSARVVLDNVDLETAKFLADHRDDLQGASATLALYYLEALQEVVLLKGTISECDLDLDRAVLTIVGFEYNTVQVPVRLYSQLCTWKFKSQSCGYAGAQTTCNKTFARCQELAQMHRFNGFLQLTRELTDLVEAPRRDQPLATAADMGTRTDLLVEP